jgi:hypothetical protein
MAGVGVNKPDPAAQQDDTAKWAALENELKTPDPILDADTRDDRAPKVPERTPDTPRVPDVPVQRQAEPAPKPDDQIEPPTPDTSEPKPKPTYEQLEANQRNTVAALREAREQAKRAEESVQAVHRMVEELRAQRAQAQPPAPKEEPIPDVDVDPIGHFNARQARMEKLIEQSLRGTQQLTEQQVAATSERQFWQHVDAEEQEYRKTKPVVEIDGKPHSDYDLACNHLRTHRMKELESMYPDGSRIAHQEARQMGLPTPAHLRAYLMQQDAAAIANRAFQLGVSPGELYYQAAVGRGYSTPASAQGQGGNKAKADAKIAAARNGQRAAVTISGGDSQKASGDMSLSDLSDLWLENPEEFDKQWEVMKSLGKL